MIILSEKKKIDILKMLSSAVLMSAAVLLWWLFGEARLHGIARSLLMGASAAFVIEAVILLLMKSRKKTVRIIKVIIILIVNISVFSCVAVYGFSEAIVLKPHSDDSAYNELQKNGTAEEIIIDGKQGKIHGWFYNTAGEDAPTVLYFYGNYETASTRLSFLSKDYSSSPFDGCNFAVFDYPAYGKSEGICSDKALLDFSLDVYDGIRERTDNLIVLGYSVGTGPAIYLASHRDVSALILYAPYSDGYDLYNNVLDIFYGPLKKLVSFNIESIGYAENVSEKTLILASENDRLIPFSSSVRLSEAFSDASFITVSPIGHNEFLSDEKVKALTESFISEVTVQ